MLIRVLQGQVEVEGMQELLNASKSIADFECVHKVDDFFREGDEELLLVVVLDFDKYQRKSEKIISTLRKKNAALPIVVIANSLDAKKMAKHQSSKLGADLYLKTPVSASFMRSIFEQFYDLLPENESEADLNQVGSQAEQSTEKTSAIAPTSDTQQEVEQETLPTQEVEPGTSVTAVTEEISLTGLDPEQLQQQENEEVAKSVEFSSGQNELKLADEETAPSNELSLSGSDSDEEAMTNENAKAELTLSNTDLTLSEDEEDEGEELDLDLLTLGDDQPGEVKEATHEDSSLELSLTEDANNDQEDILDLSLGEENEAEGASELSLSDETTKEEGLELSDNSDLESEEGISLDLGENTSDIGLNDQSDGPSLPDSTLDLPSDDIDLDVGVDLGASELELGGDELELGGDELELGGDELELGGDELELGGDELELGGENPQETVSQVEAELPTPTGEQEHSLSMSDDAKEKLKEIEEMMQADSPSDEVSFVYEEEASDFNLDQDLNLGQTAEKIVTPSGREESVRLSDPKEYEEHYDMELERLGETIKALREDREHLMQRLTDLENNQHSEKRQILDLVSERDELKVNLSVLKKRLQTDIDDMKQTLNKVLRENEVLREKNKLQQSKLQNQDRQQFSDLSKVRIREQELEAQLELLRTDSQMQIRNREHIILELKRKVDALEFDMQNLRNKELEIERKKLHQDDKIKKAMNGLKEAIRNLDDQEETQVALNAIKRNLDLVGE